MKAVFYAPMKSPSDVRPSGDRTVARLLTKALHALGYETEILEGFKAYCADPSLYGEKRQSLLDRWEQEQRRFSAAQPDLWVTYHSYYKAPDLLGPRAAKALGIPYIIFEPSYAPHRHGTCWEAQLIDALHSFESADMLLPMKTKDVAPLQTIKAGAGKLVQLPPFAPPKVLGWRAPQRLNVADTHNQTTSEKTPILLCAAMMRPGKKQDSYRFLAQALHHIRSIDWHLFVAGEGPEQRSVQADFRGLTERTTFLGKVPHNQLQDMYAATDLFVWPGLGEAYGMVYLEAAACGTPSVAITGTGVREVIGDGVTGLLVDDATPKAYAAAIAQLLRNRPRRRLMAQNAKKFVQSERSFVNAVTQLQPILASLQGKHR